MRTFQGTERDGITKTKKEKRDSVCGSCKCGCRMLRIYIYIRFGIKSVRAGWVVVESEEVP